MKERLLQYIWQFQLFNQSELTTISGAPLRILYTGQWNHHQGPDFTGARISINNILWIGNIEIHTYSKEWNSHKHSNDPNYNNVILHVVWINDIDIIDSNENLIPALELQSRISKILLSKYEDLMNASTFIACETQIQSVNELVVKKWYETLIVERFERKATLINKFLQENNFHWEETFWWLIARNFGSTVNTDCFENIARSIPLSILARHKNQIHQLEAILFGQASLLDQNFEESYPKMLQKEYKFYAKKYGLQKIPLQLFFLRMRPANFPSLRLAQLAMLINESNHLFSKIKEAENLQEVIQMLEVTPNDYWLYHYRFDEIGEFKRKNLGRDMINNILINTILPAIYTFGVHQHDELIKTKAFEWLEAIPAEKNKITRAFKKSNMLNSNAYVSQALIEMKTQYCDPKRCLECAIGNALLK